MPPANACGARGEGQPSDYLRLRWTACASPQDGGSAGSGGGAAFVCGWVQAEGGPVPGRAAACAGGVQAGPGAACAAAPRRPGKGARAGGNRGPAARALHRHAVPPSAPQGGGRQPFRPMRPDPGVPPVRSRPAGTEPRMGRSAAPREPCGPWRTLQHRTLQVAGRGGAARRAAALPHQAVTRSGTVRVTNDLLPTIVLATAETSLGQDFSCSGQLAPGWGAQSRPCCGPGSARSCCSRACRQADGTS